MRHFGKLALALLMALLLATPAAQACPMCKAALAGSDSGGDLVQGFFWSILFLLSMPFVLLGSFSAYMYLLVRRARKEALAQAAAESAVPAESATETASEHAEPLHV
jgi:hypothetical protein